MREVPKQIQDEADNCCAQTGQMYVTLDALLDVLEDAELTFDASQFIAQEPGDTIIFPR